MGLIYLDSCLIIYQVEPNPIWTTKVLSAIGQASGSAFAISSLVKSECLVVPFQLGDVKLEWEYEAAFAQHTSLSIPDRAYVDAARLCARHRLKTPDALHVACARHHGFTEMWTNDARLSAMGGWVRVLTPG